MALLRFVFVLVYLFYTNCAAAGVPSEVKLALAARDYKPAVQWLEAHSDQPDAAYELGKLLLLGKGVDKNTDRAAQLFEIAAVAGNSEGQFLLGKHYQRLNQPEKEKKWLQMAADSGHKRAQSLLKAHPSPIDSRSLLQRILAHEAPLKAISSEGVNEKDSSGRTPMMIAVEQEHEGWVEFLIASSADLNLQDLMGNTAIHYAIKGQSENLLKLLLQAGADPNVCTLEGAAPLHQSIGSNRPRFVKLLVDFGANLSLENSDGWSPAMLARRSNDQKILSIMNLKQISSNNRLDRVSEIDDPATLLLEAARTGDSELVTRLLGEKVAIEHRSNSGYSPLALAVLYGHETTVELLLKQGAVFDGIFAEKQNLVHLAVRSANSKVLALILDAVSDRDLMIDALDASRQTPLMLSVVSACLQCVKKLLFSQASTGFQDTNGNSALILAIVNMQPEIAADILVYQSEIEQRDNSGRNALWWAVRMGDVDLALALAPVSAGVSADSERVNALHVAVEEDHPQLIGALLKLVDVDLKTDSGNTALSLAAHNGSDRALRMLIVAGADLETQNKRGDTPLILAVKSSHEKIAQALLDGGANPNLRNNRFESAASLVEQGKDDQWINLLAGYSSGLGKLL